MDAKFWHGLWENNHIPFHEDDASALLVGNFPALSLAANSRVLVPLCGKTRDIAWLLSQGHRVVGVELSELAIAQLFADLGVEPKIASYGKLIRYSALNIEIFVGDIFDLRRDLIGGVSAIYDRAALFALPVETRDHYAAHLIEITNAAPQLLICFEYDQSVMRQPPYSVDGAEVSRIYSAHYDLTLLDTIVIEGGIRGKPAQDTVWLLR